MALPPVKPDPPDPGMPPVKLLPKVVSPSAGVPLTGNIPRDPPPIASMKTPAPHALATPAEAELTALLSRFTAGIVELVAYQSETVELLKLIGRRIDDVRVELHNLVVIAANENADAPAAEEEESTPPDSDNPLTSG